MVYAYQPTNPMGAAIQGYQFVQGIRQNQAAQQQAQMQMQQQAERQRNLQQAVQDLRTDPSPERIAEFGLMFPEMKEQMDSYFSTLSDAKKATQTEATQRAVLAARTGGDVAAVFDEYATAAENARDFETAKEFRDAAAFARQNPEAAAESARIRLAFTDPESYKAVYASEDPTAFQKDFAFINETFGPEAATEFAQFGRDNIVSIPIGNGQTYVGPASQAPGTSRWRQQAATPQAGTQQPPQGVETILARASEAKTISPEEANVIRSSLGRNGQAAFQNWMNENGIVISRTINGVTYYQINGTWYDNPEGR